jgi:uncharacterized protein (DUF1499 family)
MTEAQRSRLASFAFSMGVAGVLIALGGILGVQIGLLAPIQAFYTFALGTIVCGGIALICGTVSIFRARSRFGPDDRRRSVTAAAVGAVLVAIVFVSAAGGAGKPPINDITTDLGDPPAFASAAAVPAYGERDMSYPADFVPIVEQAYPDLSPIRLSAAPSEAYGRAIASARALGWTITHEDPAAGTFDASESTAIFRFVDDVTVRVRPDADGTRIDLRSKSRDGRGDLGANADRIQRFAAEIRLPPVAAEK